MAWEGAIDQLYGLADRLMEMLERGKPLSLEGAAQLPEVQALQEQIVSWLKQPGNVEGLIAASERARSEHHELVKQLRAKQQSGERYTAQEVDRLMALWEADTTLSKEALSKAGEKSEILHFTAGKLMPWLKVAARLSLIPVKDARARDIAHKVLSFSETPEREQPAHSAEAMEGAVIEVLSGERPLRELCTRYGLLPAQLIRLAACYSDAGRAALRDGVLQSPGPVRLQT